MANVAKAWSLPKVCGVCGSKEICFRDNLSGEAVCQKCADVYVHDWYLAKNMHPIKEEIPA